MNEIKHNYSVFVHPEFVRARARRLSLPSTFDRTQCRRPRGEEMTICRRWLSVRITCDGPFRRCRGRGVGGVGDWSLVAVRHGRFFGDGCVVSSRRPALGRFLRVIGAPVPGSSHPIRTHVREYSNSSSSYNRLHFASTFLKKRAQGFLFTCGAGHHRHTPRPAALGGLS